MATVRLHRKSSEGERYRAPVPAKKRNDRAIMLARQRRHLKVNGITQHYPKDGARYTTCSVCGKDMWRQ